MAAWAKANPSHSASITPVRSSSAEAREAAALPAGKSRFEQLYLNQLGSSGVRWIDLGLWDEQAGETCHASTVTAAV